VRKTQNDPSTYADLVRLCHGRGITTHFSNILGFPDQDESDIHAHVDALLRLDPYLASFYVLTPIPGTDQYDELRGGGLITETNLDRFDATCAVWRHPHVPGPRLERLMFTAYERFYSAQHVLGATFGRRWNAPWFVHWVGIAYSAFARVAARQRIHPMAGGLWRRRCDSDVEYRALRHRVFGIDRLDLPASLPLTHAGDRQLYSARPIMLREVAAAALNLGIGNQ
jgi:radical SAM superfamily enzyme YgiQ (UPF0313 family)